MKASPACALFAAAIAVVAPASAEPAPAAPKLIVAISVDQFGAGLFERYRPRFTAGLARLARGIVFDGYQSHAMTETCLGHSTILTGDRPERTGIIANEWYSAAAPRADKVVYCVEDESIPGSSAAARTISPVHMRVATMGDRMKRADPASRVVSVAGKDRAAVTMGGRLADQTWWWSGTTFATYASKPVPPLLAQANAAFAARLATAQPALVAPPECAALDKPITAGTASIGTGRLARDAGDAKAFLHSPELDGATLAVAAALIRDLRLGRGPAPDLVAIGLSATDYVGHSYGNGGPEMCLQLLALDRSLGDFLDLLDRSGVDYAVMLTADHGSQDIPERDTPPLRSRTSAALGTRPVGDQVAAALGLSANPLHSPLSFGDVWIDPAITGALRARVQDEAIRRYRALDEVAAVLTRADILAAPPRTGSPAAWTLAQKARASFDAERSGDFVVLLKQGVVPLASPSPSRVDSHGTPWEADRRVPILFWRKGIAPADRSEPAETVDILPTLAAMIGLDVPAGKIDGHCLGAVVNCPH